MGKLTNSFRRALALHTTPYMTIAFMEVRTPRKLPNVRNAMMGTLAIYLAFALVVGLPDVKPARVKPNAIYVKLGMRCKTTMMVVSPAQVMLFC
jgi:hypothetical protein